MVVARSRPAYMHMRHIAIATNACHRSLLRLPSTEQPEPHTFEHATDTELKTSIGNTNVLPISLLGRLATIIDISHLARTQKKNEAKNSLFHFVVCCESRRNGRQIFSRIIGLRAIIVIMIMSQCDGLGNSIRCTGWTRLNHAKKKKIVDSV